MPRNFAIAAILLLAAAVPATAADSLSQRVHAAAVKACAPEASASLPSSHYAAINAHCIARVSSAAMSSMEAKALERTQASTASLGN